MSNRPDVVVVGTATTRVSPTSGAGEEEEEEGGVHALRTARPCYRRGEGEGRGVWRNSPDAICINEPPDNGARSMNYVPRDSNPNETRIIAFDSSLAPPLRASRSVGRHCSSASVAASLCVVPRGKRSSFGESEIASFSFRFSVRLGVERWACRAERLGLLMEFLSRRLVGLSSFFVVGG